MVNIEVLRSPAQLAATLSKNTVVIVDFHATWCGPCKVIAPVFEGLAAKWSSLGKVAFAKCDVDENQAISKEHSVRAMPTFLIFKNRVEVSRIQGADRAALTTAIEKYAGKSGPPASPFGKGYTLGSTPTTPASRASVGPNAVKYIRNGQLLDSLPIGSRLRAVVTCVVVFLGLYFTSLLALDPMAAAEESMWAEYGKRGAGGGGGSASGGGANGGRGGPAKRGGFGWGGGWGGGPSGGPGAGGKKLGTVDDLRRSSGGGSSVA